MTERGTITITLGSNEARMLFSAYVRASDEWEAEDVDADGMRGLRGKNDSLAPSARDQRAAEAAAQKLIRAVKAKGWTL